MNPALYDTEAEAGGLACIVSAVNGEAEAMLDRLEHDDFHDIRHQTIFGALVSIQHNGGGPLNVVSLTHHLQNERQIEDAGGLVYVASLEGLTPSTANFPAYLETIRDKAARRRSWNEGQAKCKRALDTKTPIARLNRSGWRDLVEDGSDLQTRDVPPVVEIVEGIVAEFSKLSIVSSAKCFKTWLTINLALSVASGVEFLERGTNRRRVLYVNLELKPQTFTRRLQAIAKALGVTIDREWFSHLSLRGKLSGLTVAEIVTRIIQVAAEIHAQVIVVDPLFKLNVEGEENSSRDQTVFCNELDRLTTEAKCTAIFNDHSTKGNQSEKDPLDVIRGSSAKGGDLDAAMILRKHEVAECFSVDLVHRELAPVEPFVIGWEYPLMRPRPDLNPGDMKQKGKAGRRKSYDPEELCAAIVENDISDPISISGWAKAAGLERTTLNGYLYGLRAKGWIATSGEGKTARQYLTEKGVAAAKKHLEAA